MMQQTSPPVTPTQRGFERLDPVTAFAAQSCGALLIDVRRPQARRESGEITGALVACGPLRSWRLSSVVGTRVVDLGDAVPVIVLCADGHASVLVASALRGHGVRDVSDVLGGFAAWSQQGLPVQRSFTRPGEFVEVRNETRVHELV